MSKGKQPKSFRLSAVARKELANLAEHYGFSQTTAVEFLIRDGAVRMKRRREGQVKDEKRKPRRH